MIPPTLRSRVEEALERALGRPAGIAAAEPLGGGSISSVARVVTSAGDAAVLKWSGPGARPAPPGIFAAEAAGLAALAAAGAVRVPAVLACHDPVHDGPTERWLLLEWLPPAPPGPRSWAELGMRLAALHRDTHPEYGWPADNFIGSLPQRNAATPSWAGFWRERRLGPQLERAYAAGFFGAAERRRFDALLAALDDRLAAAGEEGGSLLHGDLWSGNVHFTLGGEPALLDPSVYRGHREVDLAMADLFGGFPAAFHRAYADAHPLLPGYREERRPIYQLYYLLVHVNLFGAGYVPGTLAALARAGFG